jgi:hypothetical protein
MDNDDKKYCDFMKKSIKILTLREKQAKLETKLNKIKNDLIHLENYVENVLNIT